MRSAACGLLGLTFLACSSSSSGPTQADCDNIAEEIRKNNTGPGAVSQPCSSTDPAVVAKFGKACAALADCNNKVAGK
jgi:hypothetical protein